MKNVLSYVSAFFFCLLLVSLFFEYGRFHLLLYGLTVIAHIADYCVNKRWQQWKWNKSMWWYAAFMVYYILVVLSAIRGTGLGYTYAIGDIVPFLLVGGICLMGVTDKLTLKMVAQVLVCAGAILPIYVIIRAAIAQMPLQLTAFSSARVLFVGQHIAFDIMQAIAIVCGMLLWFRTSKIWERVLLVLMIAIIYLSLFFSDGRIGFVMGNGLIAVFCFALLWRYAGKYVAIPVAVLLLGGAICLTTQHKRVSGGGLSYDPRYELWQAAWQTIKAKPIIGYGSAEGAMTFGENARQYEQLMQHFAWSRARSEKYNPAFDIPFRHPHNWALLAWIELGIIGLLLVLFIYAYPFYSIRGGNKCYWWLILGIFVLQTLVDVFGAYVPPYPFILFYYLFYQEECVAG